MSDTVFYTRGILYLQTHTRIYTGIRIYYTVHITEDYIALPTHYSRLQANNFLIHIHVKILDKSSLVSSTKRYFYNYAYLRFFE